MTFSTEWNDAYKNNTNLSIWPWADLIHFVKRYSGPFTKKFRVLELGCGAGANIPFFNSLNVEYFGIEGSIIIVENLKEKFPQLKDNLTTCDFTKTIPFSGKFDLILDRSSLAHNSTLGIESCLNLVYEKLNTNGKYIGIDWFSTSHSEYVKGEDGDDIFTRKNYLDGQFKNLGNAHFSNQNHLEDLFKKFKFLVLEEKIIKPKLSENNQIRATWNFIVEKI